MDHPLRRISALYVLSQAASQLVDRFSDVIVAMTTPSSLHTVPAAFMV